MLGLSMAACTSHGPKAPAEYPSAPTDSTAVDEYFGHKVTDLYRPLENDTATATLQWVKAENAVTDAYLSAIPFRDKVRRRCLLWPTTARPDCRGERRTANTTISPTTDFRTSLSSMKKTP